MYIFHGDNQQASRLAYLELKDQISKSGQQIVNLEGSKINISDLVSSVGTISLLGSVNSVFITELFARRPSKEKKDLISYLVSHNSSPITIWESKDQTIQLKEFSLQIIKKYDLPKYVFQFLETLTLDSLQLALKTAAPEQILSLLAGQIHKMFLVRDNSADLPSWQLVKLQSQAAKFNFDQLRQMNRTLLSVDYSQKTSVLPYDLKTALELWVLSL